ncbi:MAG: hypothetical protein M1832_000035 [Thelocarpon impressellum]|nr:MAG: hypothetical protein M1832_000035 [Thelocarpon impressellum]
MSIDPPTTPTGSEIPPASCPSAVQAKRRRTNAYHADFEQHLITNGIFPPHYQHGCARAPAPRPKNEKELMARLLQPRASLSDVQLTAQKWNDFVRREVDATNEDMMMRMPFQDIAGAADISKSNNKAFTNLVHLTDGTIVDAKPDHFDGTRPEHIHARILAELGEYIWPSLGPRIPALPTFFAEVKGPLGLGSVATRQASHNGAIGARAVHKLQGFGTGADAVHDGNAYIFTCTYSASTLRIFVTHPSASKVPGRFSDYHMTQLRSWCLDDCAETFRQAVAAFRNARDLADEQRTRLVMEAKARVG